MNTQSLLTSVQCRWQFWIDCSGTFTDIVARRQDRTLLTHKPYRGSLATVAASAMTGKITDPREFMVMEAALCVT